VRKGGREREREREKERERERERVVWCTEIQEKYSCTDEVCGVQVYS